jgi:Leucine-rich repeat (LRR) protein
MKIDLNPVNAFRLFVIVCLVFSAVVLPANPPTTVYAQPLLQEETPTPTQEEVTPTPEVTETPTEPPTETPTPEITEEPTETATPEITEEFTPTPEVVTETPEPPTAEPAAEDAESQAAICASAAFPVECEALAKLYTSTNGAEWTNKSSWLKTNDVCSWYGITCSGSGNVTKIVLPSNRLTGVLPAELSDLSNLQELNFQNNALTGTLPSELTKLKNVLLAIDLNTNSYSGEIPAWIGQMTELKSLLLSFNRFSGPIPTSFGNLKKLERLEMARNRLTGPIPSEIGGMENILFIWAYENQITGSIPASVNNLTKIKWFHFANNQLTGTIPSLSNVNLQVFNLANNNLTGSLPSINHMSQLELMDLSNNGLTGAITVDFSKTPLLENLNLSKNQLTGSIPTSLGSLPNLEKLNLGNNSLTGNIPSQLQNLTNLKALYLNNNQLQGTWPIWLQNLTKLEVLNLSNNYQLGDLLPPEIGNLTNLRLLDISRNHFWGEIPSTITKLTKLNTANSVGVRSYTDIGHNHLTSKNTTVRGFLSNKDPDWEKTQTPTNAPPVIQSLNPPYVIIGHPTSETLQVRGKNMMDGAVVYLDGVEYTTTFINKWTLEIEVPSSMFASERTIVVTAKNPWPTLGESAGYNFYVSNLRPAVGSTVLSRRPDFLWYPVTGAASYQFQISTSKTFSTGVTTLTSVPNYLEYTKDLPINKMMYWRVRALIGTEYQSWSDVYSFRSARPPTTPVLAAPANKSLTTNYKPKLTWKDISLPSGTVFEKYQVQVANDPSFAIGTVVVDEDITKRATLSYTLKDGDLQPNTVYYWRVRSFNTLAHYSNWSAVRSIRSAMLPPVLSTTVPSNPADTPRPLTQWAPVAGATGYSIQYSIYSNFSTIYLSATTKGNDATSYTPTKSLPQNRIIYWRVRAAGPNGPSLWSKSSFRSANSPSAPALTSPSNNSLITTVSPVLKWKASSVPSGTTFSRYDLQIATDAGFSNKVYDEQINNRLTTSFQPTLVANTRYYWRVRSWNTANQFSIWSVRSFRTSWLPVTSLSVSEAVTPRPTVSWNAPVIAGSGPPPVSYTVQFSLSSSFGTLITSGTTNSTLYSPTVDLPRNKTIYWRVRANGEFGPTAWVSNSFLSSNAPSTPALAAPSNNFLSTDLQPVLKWNASTLPAGTFFKHYSIEVSTDPAFVINVHQHQIDTITTLTYQVPAGVVLPNNRYYWRVRAENSIGHYSTWSTVRYFRAAMIKPVLMLPAQDSTAQTRRPEFTWTSVPGATSYTIHLSLYSNFSSLLTSGTTSGTMYTPSINLVQNKVIYWRVRANGTNGPSLWSDGPRWFTSANPPSTPTLVSPANGALLKSNPANLDWSNASVPIGTEFARYEVEIATDTSFTTNYQLIPAGIGDRTQSFLAWPTLLAKTKYYWRVRSVNTDGHMSAWSTRWSFTTP